MLSLSLVPQTSNNVDVDKSALTLSHASDVGWTREALAEVIQFLKFEALKRIVVMILNALMNGL